MMKATLIYNIFDEDIIRDMKATDRKFTITINELTYHFLKCVSTETNLPVTKIVNWCIDLQQRNYEKNIELNVVDIDNQLEKDLKNLKSLLKRKEIMLDHYRKNNVQLKNELVKLTKEEISK